MVICQLLTAIIWALGEGTRSFILLTHFPNVSSTLSFFSVSISLPPSLSHFHTCKSLYKFARFKFNLPPFRVCCQLTKVFFKTQLAALSTVRLCLCACVGEYVSVHPFWPLTRVSANFIKGLPASKTKLSFKWYPWPAQGAGPRIGTGQGDTGSTITIQAHTHTTAMGSHWGQLKVLDSEVHANYCQKAKG